MAALSIKWKDGNGYIYLSQDKGEGNATISIYSDANIGGSRSQDILFKTTNQNSIIEKRITVRQYGITDEHIYDGGFADTSEFSRTLDGGYANSSFNSNVDIVVDGDNA